MSEPKWTPAQRAAIEDRGGALLVSAAAGSGKTAVLTERAVRLITDPEHPVDADRLLIVTFTNAAAAELRARIGQALLKRSQAEPGNGALRRQRMLLQRAPICTIDAFCLDLLRKHFQALDIPPDFSPADPGSVELLRASALSETLENAYRDPDFCAFADLYGKGRTDRAAGETILHVYDFLRALPDYDKKLEEFLAPWQEENGFAATCWHDLLLAEAARSARAAGELFRAALADCPGDREQELADAEEKKTPSAREKAKNAVLEKYTDAQERLDKAAALLGRVEQLAVAGEWTPLYDLLTPYVLGMEELPGLKGMKKRLNGEHKKVIRTRADEGAALFAQILELIPCSEEEAEADRRAAEPRLRALFAAVRDFDARFSAKKRDRKLLEFSDFEHQALRLLRDPDGTPTALCGVIRQNYAAVMVDEYQDTNALQDALYRCLASPAGDDLFLVGDLKQSIYRFRQADPSIFREKLDSWPALPGGAARPCPAEGTSGTDAMLALDANFRSAPQVVEGINFLFERLMSPELGDTAYGDGQRLVCGAPGEYTGSVEAHFLPDDTAETDAGWIARRIEEMVQSGEPVREGRAPRRAADARGRGAPATRAAVIEKLVKGGFAERKGKQLIPTQNGAALISVLPDMLTSPQLTAEWENNLTQIAKGAADPGEFLSGIEAMARELVQTHAAALDGKKDLFREEKPSVGKCPRCGSPVHEGKKNYYCSNKECAFVMWKNDRFFEERKTAFSAKIAAALLKSGKVNVKKLYSPKTGKTYDGTIVLADTGGKYVNYRIEVQKN